MPHVCVSTLGRYSTRPWPPGKACLRARIRSPRKHGTQLVEQRPVADVSAGAGKRTGGKNREWTRIHANEARGCTSSRGFAFIRGWFSFFNLMVALAGIVPNLRSAHLTMCEENKVYRIDHDGHSKWVFSYLWRRRVKVHAMGAFNPMDQSERRPALITPGRRDRGPPCCSLRGHWSCDRR